MDDPGDAEAAAAILPEANRAHGLNYGTPAGWRAACSPAPGWFETAQDGERS